MSLNHFDVAALLLGFLCLDLYSPTFLFRQVHIGAIMRFPIAVGILTQSVMGASSEVLRRRGGRGPPPPLAKVFHRPPANHRRQEKAYGGLISISTNTGKNGNDGNSDETIIPVMAGTGGAFVRSRGRPSFSRNFRNQQHNSKVEVNKSMKTASRRECNPDNQIDNGDGEFLGILSCGMGEFCMESTESAIGGYCIQESSSHPSLHYHPHDAVTDGRRFQEDITVEEDYTYPITYTPYQVFCNSSSAEFAPSAYNSLSCDCSGFDAILYDGNIHCNTNFNCQSNYEPNICVEFSYTFTYTYDPYDLRATVCGSTLGQEFCVMYDYYPTTSCVMYHNGLQCQACSVNLETSCLDFDCNNVVEGGHAGTNCDETQSLFKDPISDLETNEVACLLIWEPLKSRPYGYECSCSTVLEANADAKDPAFSLDCNLRCDSCDGTGRSCGTVSSQHLLTEGRDNIRITQKYKYTAGRDEAIVVTKKCSADDSLSLSCSTCEVAVDGKSCNSCEIVVCDQGGFFQSTKFNCSNIEAGAILDPCVASTFVSGDLLFGPNQPVQACTPPPPKYENTINSTDFGFCSDTPASFLMMDGPTTVGEVLQTALSSDSTIPSCGGLRFDREYSGVWLNFIGNGQNVTATTCSPETNFDTAISVYAGPSCGSLTCIAGNRDADCVAGGKIVGSAASSLAWVTQNEVLYHIRVHGNGASFGQFGLSLTSSPIVQLPPESLPPSSLPPTTQPSVSKPATSNPPSTLPPATLLPTSSTQPAVTQPPATTLPPETGGCAGSVPLEVGDDQTVSISAVNVLSQIGGCTSTSPLLGFGGWYEVIGDGNIYTITSCPEDLNVQTGISIYTGGCDSLVCANQYSHSSNCAGDGDRIVRNNATSVSWMTVPGEKYNMMVSGSSSGEYNVTLAKQQPATNSECSSADTSLAGGLINETRSGSTMGAIQGPVASGDFCGVAIDQPGVWYTLDGTNETLRISACTSDVAHFEVSVSVFTGTCENLTCVDGRSFSTVCSDEVSIQEEKRLLQDVTGDSSLTWLAKAETVYYVLVHGQDPSFGDGGVGTFEIVVEGEPQPIKATEVPTRSPLAGGDDPTAAPTFSPSATGDADNDVSPTKSPSSKLTPPPSKAPKGDGGNQPNEEENSTTESPTASSAAAAAVAANSSVYLFTIMVGFFVTTIAGVSGLLL